MTHGYSSTVMDHFESPRNAGRLIPADAKGEADVAGGAPRITLHLKLRAETIERAAFQSFGCGAAIAAASMLTELVSGQTIAFCRGLNEADLDRALGGLPANKRFCAALAVLALNNAIDCLRSASDL